MSYGAVASPFIPAASCREFWRRRIKRAAPVVGEFFLDIPLKSRFIPCAPIELNREGEANGESIEAQRNDFNHLIACDLFLSM